MKFCYRWQIARAVNLIEQFVIVQPIHLEESIRLNFEGLQFARLSVHFFTRITKAMCFVAPLLNAQGEEEDIGVPMAVDP